MRMLISLLTNTTSRLAYCVCRLSTTLIIWLSALLPAKPGNSVLTWLVCRNNRPVTCRLPWIASGQPFSKSTKSVPTISSRLRLACRALRATSVSPFLLLSSSSSVTIGKKMSCSSNLNSEDGSCINTLVSSTNSFVLEDSFFAIR